MGVKSVVAFGLCFTLSGTVIVMVGSAAVPVAQINIPNINPQVERRFEQLRDKEEGERMGKECRQDAQSIVLLAAELKQYADAADGELSADAVRKADQVAKLARRLHHRLNQSARRLRAR